MISFFVFHCKEFLLPCSCSIYISWEKKELSSNEDVTVVLTMKYYSHFEDKESYQYNIHPPISTQKMVPECLL